MSLSGKRILITRSEDQNEELASLVRRAGGVPVLFPTIRLVAPEALGAALADELLAAGGRRILEEVYRQSEG